MSDLSTRVLLALSQTPGNLNIARRLYRITESSQQCHKAMRSLEENGLLDMAQMVPTDLGRSVLSDTRRHTNVRRQRQLQNRKTQFDGLTKRCRLILERACPGWLTIGEIHQYAGRTGCGPVHVSSAIFGMPDIESTCDYSLFRLQPDLHFSSKKTPTVIE